MAIGLGLMLGFVFPKNFDSPYKSASITEFWRRWHLSLSTWLRDYLYVPLGGNRLGPRRTYVNLALVMLLGGLWHGAAWNFVAWGAFHGVLLAVERMRGRRGLFDALPRTAAVAGTFVLVLVSWVFFRAADLGLAVGYLGDMAGLGTVQAGAPLLGGVIYKPYYLLTVGVAAAIAFGAPQTWDWTRSLPVWKESVCLCCLVLALLALSTKDFNPFIYFIFEPDAYGQDPRSRAPGPPGGGPDDGALAHRAGDDAPLPRPDRGGAPGADRGRSVAARTAAPARRGAGTGVADGP
jgi:alginate O-acetyltransferase complex protein AlgI